MRVLSLRTDHWVTGAAINRAIANAEAQPSPILAYTVILGYRADGDVSAEISQDQIIVKCATRRSGGIVSDYEIVAAMQRFGGSFAQALAVAAQRADPENFGRLKMAFPEMWREYEELARLARQRAEEHTR
jgi:hypothetical protein